MILYSDGDVGLLFLLVTVFVGQLVVITKIKKRI